MISIVNRLKKLNYIFIRKPLVVGGTALEYYDIRKSGHGLDLVVSIEDWLILKKLYPENINLYGGKDEKEIDATINLENFDLIKTLYQHNYDDLCDNYTEIFNEFKIISVEKLLMLKTLDAVYNKTMKSITDQKLIVDFIVRNKYT
tara:strand:+ start:1895 stop:2332 length:438 start_codon:yes stop_codon:yes gene_type:complete